MGNLICSAGNIAEDITYVVLKTEAPVGAQAIVFDNGREVTNHYDDFPAAKEWAENQAAKLRNIKYKDVD